MPLTVLSHGSGPEPRPSWRVDAPWGASTRDPNKPLIVLFWFTWVTPADMKTAYCWTPAECRPRQCRGDRGRAAQTSTPNGVTSWWGLQNLQDCKPTQVHFFFPQISATEIKQLHLWMDVKRDHHLVTGGLFLVFVPHNYWFTFNVGIYRGGGGFNYLIWPVTLE